MAIDDIRCGTGGWVITGSLPAEIEMNYILDQANWKCVCVVAALESGLYPRSGVRVF